MDVLKLKDINIRVDFNDASSSASFPNNDWRITINSSLNGGPDFFAIDDSTNQLRPFMIEDQSQDEALVISDTDGPGSDPRGGYIGIGTEDPLMEMHVFHGDSPGMRLEQDGSEGFGTYAWDVAANETNFFVRDVTAGDVLPFRIFPGSSDGSLTVDDNQIGVGTTDPQAGVHVQLADGEAPMLVENTSSGVNTLEMDPNGNVTIAGLLTEGSSAHVKENRRDVDADAVLAKVASLPVQTWNYTWDDDGVRHMGPMAQDVYEAFGLGTDAEHLAPLDVNGVALASIQALLARLETQQDRAHTLEEEVQSLQEENEALRSRLERLEAAVDQLMNAPASE